MKIHIRKNADRIIKQEDVLLLAAFLVSAFNSYFPIILFTVLALYAVFIQRDSAVVLKTLSLFVLRTTAVNSQLFSSFNSFGGYRYVLIFFMVGSMIFLSKVDGEGKRVCTTLFIGLLIFSATSVLSILFNGSFPTLSLVRLLLYVTAFYGVVKTIGATHRRVDWVEYFCLFFGIIFFISIFTIPIMSLRTRNGHAFQGVLGHPNNFGIYAAVYLAFLCASKRVSRNFRIFMIAATIYMLYLSESRTGMLSALLVVALAMFVYYKDRMGRFVFIVAVSVLALAFAAILFDEFLPTATDVVSDFLWKKHKESLFYSKRGPIKQFAAKFAYDPIIGTGFMAPFQAGIRDWSLNFELFVEDANVFLSVLGNCGIIGFLIWVTLFSKLFSVGNKRLCYCFIAPFIISSGEMVFFSTNSAGLMLYVLFGIFLFSPKESEGSLS